MSGVVEMDEAYIGGKAGQNGKWDNKAAIFGAVERQGNVYATQVRSTGARVLLPTAGNVVKP